MDSFFEQFINGVHQEAQQVLSYFFGYPPYRCTVVKFGGFCYSHNWYGKTDLVYDKVGNLKIYTQTVYLNSLFITKQFGITNNSEYDLPKLANTIAHELTHCLIANYEPKRASEHNFGMIYQSHLRVLIIRTVSQEAKKPSSLLTLLKKFDQLSSSTEITRSHISTFISII